MGVADRRARERTERQQRLVAAARELAERDGWAAVTTRRLADEIEYTPPVLYQHFPDGRDGIVTAVALLGFAEFVDAVADTVAASPRPVAALIDSYISFAQDNPATYEAMFAMPISARFAREETPEVMRRGFAIIVDALGPDDPDVDVRAELLWSALHGLCELRRRERLDPALESARREQLAALFGA
ncbi:TetR/AcrR family transcriptional regulator [Gordonia sp. DT30]|uniref:TetR/AcrR family transcriptional regulator n=1 Tax=unclassified Gordonia (in: high G+C Gram-positive bacteria) TaxID=2657482 RepID=UPI003CF2D95F